MIFNSLFTAFRMYSRIPVPQTEWKTENRRFALCFFPAVGLVCGLLFFGWFVLCRYLGISSLLQGAVMMLIPLSVTGGFHMDGFCDVQDALASCAPPEKKLEILKDPHIGSFAVIRSAAYLILQTACYAQLSDLRIAASAALAFVLSRSLSGLCAILFPAAKKEGSLQDFVVPADRKTTMIVLSAVSAVSAAAMLLAHPAAGALLIAASALCLVHYRNTCLREFGGITGDCAGWFLQNCELSAAAVCAAVQILCASFS